MSEAHEPDEPQEPEEGTTPGRAPHDEEGPLPDLLAKLATIGRIDPLAGVRTQLADISRMIGPAAAIQAQLRRNDELLASVRSKIVADAGLTTLPSIMASLRPQIDPLAGVRTQLADISRMAGPAAAIQAQLRRNDELLASVRSKIVADAGLTT
ncbi:hypothetical protein ACFYPB_40430, partial [Streptomyces olivaceoviridis]|uniref:hypothetical protein n=1 Tax=Streptomyces olivaceoviridis TaxID=1921 RepID=UPI003699362C